MTDRKYPDDAYSPDGRFWWEIEFAPGKRQRFGVAKRIAAWLSFNLDAGDTVTMRHLREVITQDGAPNTDEHFNRRFRELRDAGWMLSSNKEDGSLGRDEYRLDVKGLRIWIDSESPVKEAISQRLRRMVFERDGGVCQICGVAGGEEYPREPGSRARLTVGHLRANALKGGVDLLNVRTECSRCNEPIRDEMSIGFGLNEIWPRVRRLSSADKDLLRKWLLNRARPPAELLYLFDEISHLEPDEIDIVISRLGKAGDNGAGI